MISKGYGESDPIAPNKNSDGSDNPQETKNRRVEFKVLNELSKIHYMMTMIIRAINN